MQLCHLGGGGVGPNKQNKKKKTVKLGEESTVGRLLYILVG